MHHHFEDIHLHCIPTPTPFPVGDAHVYLHKGETLTLFDAGTHTGPALAALEAGLAAAGVNLSDIDQVFLTHHHLDHIGLTRKIKDASGAIIYAHPKVPEQIPYMFDEAKTRFYLEKLLMTLGAPLSEMESVISQRHQYRALLDDFVVDQTVTDQASIGAFTAYFRPGHSATDTVYVHREEGWAIMGDHLIRQVTPNPILRRCPEQGEREKSLVEYHAALLETRALSLTRCFAGHGAPFPEHREVVDATLRHIERRSRKVLDATPEQGATPYEMTRLLFPRLSEPQLYYCLSAATGHLELLEYQGKLQSRQHDGVLYYRPVSA